MTFNGLDLLFVIIAFPFVYLLIEKLLDFWSWSRWDRRRRLGRKYYRRHFQDCLDEAEYRLSLRLQDDMWI